MHVLIANNIYPPIMAGGAELIVAMLAEGLVGRGHRVTVVSTCSPEAEPYPVETRNGVEVIRFFPKNRYWHWERGDRRGYEKALWHLRDAWNRDAGIRFRKILSEQKPDILHTHLIDGMSATLWRQARKAKIPVIHTAHDYHLLCPRALLLTKSLKICTTPQTGCRIYRGWHIHTTRYIDLFCSPSKFLIDKHIETGLAAKATAVVRNGIILPKIIIHRQGDKNKLYSFEEGITQGRQGEVYDIVHEPKPDAGENLNQTSIIKFLFAARLTVEKGCEILLEALKLLPDDLPFEFSVAGKGVYADKFTELAASDQRIRYLGYISGEEKDAIFRKTDWLLIPSLWYENAPVVIVEAAAYGLGVIGSNIGAIPEFVQHEKTGLLFEAGNARSLADSIIRAVHDRQILQNSGQFTKPFLATSSVDNMVDSYLAHYETLAIQ